MVDRFEIYLRAELGKLRYRGDAVCFITALAPCGLLKEIGLPDDPDSLSQRFGSQAAVATFVADLSTEMRRRLARCCGDRWRLNPDLNEQLASAEHWLEEKVEVEHIFLKPAERDLCWLFSELGYRLTAIANDQRLHEAVPYRETPAGTPVEYPVCLAKRHPDGYRLFDGMHRAIQLVRNGENRIPICFAENAEPMVL